MPSTPEPTSLRARTPPTPLHGPRYDHYEPYSPRRSTRSTAQSNPYSSLNSDRSPKAHLQRATTPPPTAKKARFAPSATQLSSPPSSPASPAKRPSLHRTPRKHVSAPSAHSLSDHAASSLAPPTLDLSSMLPTPSKAPKTRQAAAMHSTARLLNFQPSNPNDVMPSPRKVSKHNRHHSLNRFELYDEEVLEADNIEVFTDANARVPEMDEAEDNPFVGAKSVPKPQSRSKRRSNARSEGEERIEEAVARDEGMIYVFRGKKIFRRFEKDDDADSSSAGTEVSEAMEQRSLKRKAGVSAQRPLTRSSVKPRLLFPSDGQLREREEAADDADEEAVTDIEIPNAASTPAKQKGKAKDVATPSKEHTKHLATPPPTKRTTRTTNKKTSPAQVSPIYEDEPEPMSASIGEVFSTSGGRSGGKSPFAGWQRTKAGSSSGRGRKREGAPIEEGVAGGGKRTRSGMTETPA